MRKKETLATGWRNFEEKCKNSGSKALLYVGLNMVPIILLGACFLMPNISSIEQLFLIAGIIASTCISCHIAGENSYDDYDSMLARSVLFSSLTTAIMLGLFACSSGHLISLEMGMTWLLLTITGLGAYSYKETKENSIILFFGIVWFFAIALFFGLDIVEYFTGPKTAIETIGGILTGIFMVSFIGILIGVLGLLLKAANNRETGKALKMFAWYGIIFVSGTLFGVIGGGIYTFLGARTPDIISTIMIWSIMSSVALAMGTSIALIIKKIFK